MKLSFKSCASSFSKSIFTPVTIKNAPKMYINQAKWCSKAAPPKMKITRITKAPKTPQNSKRCWYFNSIPKKPNTKMKINKLSILNDFSSKYAVTKSSAWSPPVKNQRPPAKMKASPIQKALHNNDSFMVGASLFLWKTPKSSANITKTKAKKPIQ